MSKVFHTYIIESVTSKRWYYGATADLTVRLEHHNKGWNRSTKGRGPWKFVMVRQFDTWMEAREFELELKAMKNKSRIRKKFREYFLEEE